MSDDAIRFGPDDTHQLVIQALLEGGIIGRFSPGHGTRAGRLSGYLSVLVDPHHLRHLDREVLEVMRARSGEHIQPYVEVELAETAEELVPYLQWDATGPLEEVRRRAFERLGEVGQ